MAPSAASGTSSRLILERLVRQAGAGIGPGDHEHGIALIDGELDEAVFGLEIENIELVDPRWHDQQRPLVYLVGGREILDQPWPPTRANPILDRQERMRKVARAHGDRRRERQS